jgi:hypothetical protein
VLALGKRQFCRVEIGEDVTAGDAGVVLEVSTCLTLRGSEWCERVEPKIYEKPASLRYDEPGTDPV